MKLYLKFLSIHLRSAMQYKMSFVFRSIGMFLVTFSTFIGIFFMLSRFQTVGGFTINQVMLCYSVVLAAFSFSEIFFRGFDAFGSTVRSGEFDRILLRPRNEVYLTLCSKTDLARFGRFLQAVLMLAYAIPTSGVVWTWQKALVLLFMLVGGIGIFCGLFMVYAGFCFFTLEGLEFMNIFTDGAREHGKYPFSIYGTGVLKFLTYVIPLACFQYYPLTYLLGMSNNPLDALTPIFSLLFVIPCFFFWRFGLRHYKSSGS